MSAHVNVTLQCETWKEFSHDAQELWRRHFHELASDREMARPCANVEYYAAMEQLGMLCIVTARRGAPAQARSPLSSSLLGYFVFTLGAHPHFAHTLYGIEDAYYLAREARCCGKGLSWRSFLGTRLIERAMDEARARGAKKFICMSNAELGQNSGALLRKLGMTKVNEVYSIWMGA